MKTPEIEDALFTRGHHTIQIKVYLTPEEFVAFEHLGLETGLGQSPLARYLIVKAIRDHASKLCAGRKAKPMSEQGTL